MRGGSMARKGPRVVPSDAYGEAAGEGHCGDERHTGQQQGGREDQMITTIRAVVHDRRIDVPAPLDLPDGTEVLLTIGKSVPDDDGPMSPEEIARVHTAMQKLLPLDIPEDVAADLDAFERQLNQYGIDNADKGVEDVFR
jgi:hypothetical protein